jgi:3-methyladenine DNA glycosylase AlkD
MFFAEVEKITRALLADEDDMVQKGLGWLLRETARYDAKKTMPLLMSIRESAPRLVLRTACERLTEAERRRVLTR